MGQYYKVVNIDKKEFIEPWDYDCGSKLLEWGYITSDGKANGFAGALNKLMCGRWKGDRVYVVGDYAEPDSRDGDLGLIQSVVDTLTKGNSDVTVETIASGSNSTEGIQQDIQAKIDREDKNTNSIIWQAVLGDIFEEFAGTELGKKDEDGYTISFYRYAEEHFEKLHPEDTESFVAPRYLCNDVTKEYIDLRNLPFEWNLTDDDDNEIGVYVSIHPLAILLAMGNGQGGGDYFGVNSEEAGSWTPYVKDIMFRDEIPAGFTKYEFSFAEREAA